MSPEIQAEVSRIQNIIQSKVTGRVVAAHDEFGHHYKLPSGEVVDSVTTKLIVDKPHLIKWAVRMGFEWMEQENRWQRLNKDNRDEFLKGAILAHTDYRDTAGSIGHQAHAVIEQYLNTWMAMGAEPKDIKDLVPFGSQYQVFGAVRSAEAGFKKYHVVPVASELLVGSDKYQCAGTLDALMLYVFAPGVYELELWDFKSSNQVSDSYALQVSAYKKFFEDMTGLKIKRCRILHIDKYSDKFKFYNVPNIVKAFKAFKAINEVYNWVNNHSAKLIEDKIIIKI